MAETQAHILEDPGPSQGRGFKQILQVSISMVFFLFGQKKIPSEIEISALLCTVTKGHTT